MDYAALTTVVGIITLMLEEERNPPPEMTQAKLSVESTICELFLTIRNLESNLLESGQFESEHVIVNGRYSPVVPWCSVRSSTCRLERNAIILTQLVQFATVLRANIRAMSIG